MHQSIHELPKMLEAARFAAGATLEIYASGFEVEEKADHSPLTTADRRAHDIIQEHLEPTGLPILSEEGRHLPYSTRKTWQSFFLVDPLDGTKEFIKRNGEFTVNIALVDGSKPIAGVIVVPVKDILYLSAPGLGARRMDGLQKIFPAKTEISLKRVIDASVPLPEPPPAGRPFTVIGSRSHGSKALQDYVARLGEIHGEMSFVSAGSSLKFCKVAEGSADVYPRTGPTCEWDTAAGQAIAEHAGAEVIEFETGRPLRYNKKKLLNPWFVVKRD